MSKTQKYELVVLDFDRTIIPNRNTHNKWHQNKHPLCKRLTIIT